MQTRSLRQLRPERRDIPALIALSLLLLIAGQILPVVTLDTLGPSRDTYSIVGGVIQLVGAGDVILGGLIFLFSVLFPIVKLIALLAIWWRPMEPPARARSIKLLEILGKWSMLDVFVVAVLAGAVELGILAEAEPEPGVYVFACAVLVSLVVTFLMARIAARDGSAVAAPSPRPVGAPVAVLGLLALGLFLVGLFLPLMHVERWLFWDREYSVLRGTLELLAAGDVFLGILVGIFVVLLPLASFAAAVALSFVRGERWSWLRSLHRWSMVDVFGLAVLIVITKVGGLATVEPRAGLWLFVGAAVLSVFVSWRLERADGSATEHDKA